MYHMSKNLRSFLILMIGVLFLVSSAKSLKVSAQTETQTDAQSSQVQLTGSLTLSSFSAAPKEKVQLTAAVENVTGTCRYQFKYKNPDGEIVTISPYSTENTAVFSAKKTGRYIIYLILKDEQTRIKISRVIWVKKALSGAELTLRKKVIHKAMRYVGISEGSKEHLKILSIYNGVQYNVYRPAGYSLTGKCFYRHYKISRYEAWCDAFVSAMFKSAGLSGISGVECSCMWHLRWLKDHNSFIEADDYVPDPGDIIFYDWDDTGEGNCKGYPDHVGIVVKVSKTGVMTVIEGNRKDSVGYHQVNLNNRCIRGYGVPNYKSKL